MHAADYLAVALEIALETLEAVSDAESLQECADVHGVPVEFLHDTRKFLNQLLNHE